MIKIEPGAYYLVQQHDWGTGERIISATCVASISPKSDNSPEHAVLTEVHLDGTTGHSVRFFPPDHYHEGAIPIARVVSRTEPSFIESVSKIPR